MANRNKALDKEQSEKKQEKLELQRKQELEDLKELLDRPAGVRFFRRFLEKGMVFRTTFTGNSQTFFNEGHRNLALNVLNDIIEARPDKITELMKPIQDN